MWARWLCREGLQSRWPCAAHHCPAFALRRVWFLECLDWTAWFGVKLNAAFADLPIENTIFNGEVVAIGGVPVFSALQDALATGATERPAFYAFDLFRLDGY